MIGASVHYAPTEGGPLPTGLADAVRTALDKTGHGWLRRIEVGVESGCVVLRGRVKSFYLKQMAQVTVLAVPGADLVRNDLQVEGGRR